jgi:hypothetical protein
MRFAAPFEAIDIMRMAWTLAMPENYRILHDTGTLRRVEEGRRLEARLAGLNPDEAVQAAARSKGDMRPQARSLQREANLLAMQAVSQDADRSARRSIYTGSKPMQRNRYDFQGLLMSDAKPAWVEARYLKSSMALPLHGVVAFVVLGLGALVARWRRLSVARRLALLVLVGLALLAVRTLAEGAYGSLLLTALVALAAVAVAFVLGVVVRGIRNTVRRRREARESGWKPVAPRDEAPGEE